MMIWSGRIGRSSGGFWGRGDGERGVSGEGERGNWSGLMGWKGKSCLHCTGASCGVDCMCEIDLHNCIGPSDRCICTLTSCQSQKEERIACYVEQTPIVFRVRLAPSSKDRGRQGKSASLH